MVIWQKGGRKRKKIAALRAKTGGYLSTRQGSHHRGRKGGKGKKGKRGAVGSCPKKKEGKNDQHRCRQHVTGVDWDRRAAIVPMSGEKKKKRRRRSG